MKTQFWLPNLYFNGSVDELNTFLSKQSAIVGYANALGGVIPSGVAGSAPPTSTTPALTPAQTTGQPQVVIQTSEPVQTT